MIRTYVGDVQTGQIDAGMSYIALLTQPLHTVLMMLTPSREFLGAYTS